MFIINVMGLVIGSTVKRSLTLNMSKIRMSRKEIKLTSLFTNTSQQLRHVWQSLHLLDDTLYCIGRPAIY